MSAITSHVLDLASGVPAAGVEIALEFFGPAGWTSLGRGTTDADGRLREAFAKLPGPGRYRLTFATGAYFAARRTTSFHPEVCVVFEVRDASQPHHVPLLLSPYGYSTYRGS